MVWDEAGDSDGSWGGRNRGEEGGACWRPTLGELWDDPVTAAATSLRQCARCTPGNVPGASSSPGTPERGGVGGDPRAREWEEPRGAGREDREEPWVGGGGPLGEVGRSPSGVRSVRREDTRDEEWGFRAGDGRIPARVREEEGA